MATDQTCSKEWCDLPVYSGGLCILHDLNPDKDQALFLDTLKRKLEDDAANDDVKAVDLRRVVSPGDFSWSDAWSDEPFPKPISFGGAQFTQRASFDGAQFTQQASFLRAQLTGVAYFDSAQFTGEASFGYAQFTQTADFTDAVFSNEHDTTFENAIFSSTLRFRHTNFPKRDGPGRLIVRGVVLEKPEEVFFEHLDLSCTSFLRTNVSRVNFIGITSWAKKYGNFWNIPLWRFKNREYTVAFDHLELDRDEVARTLWRNAKNLLRSNVLRRLSKYRRWKPARRSAIRTLGLITRILSFWRSYRLFVSELGVFIHGSPLSKEAEAADKSQASLIGELNRQLRLNLEQGRQEIEAGAFYVGQMDMRKEDPGFRGALRLLLSVYRFIAMYGESYARPLALYVVLGLLLALAYRLLGTVSYAEGLFSALTLGPLFRDPPDGINGWEKLLVYFNMLADIFLLGLTLVALRRQFRR